MHGFSHTVVNPDYISENNPPDSANNRYSPRSVSDNSDNEQGSSSSSEQSSDGDVNYSAGQSQYSQYSKVELHITRATKSTPIWTDAICKNFPDHWPENGPIQMIEYNGQSMVLKIAPIEDERKCKNLISEAKIYERLQPLQGT